jgi:hypothetical protein
MDQSSQCKDGSIPTRCAKCKTSNWDRDAVSPKENGLRRRIKGFKKLYKYAGDFWSDYSIANCWSGELTEEFLSLDPLPTIKDLERVVCPPGLVIKSLGLHLNTLMQAMFQIQTSRVGSNMMRRNI